MAVITTKPNTKLPWASQGNRAEPTSDKQLEGWVQEIPPHEMENWIQYKQDLAVKYLYQEGIPEWDSSFEYNVTSYVKYNGVIYKLKDGAEVPNTNKQPDIETTSWEIAFEPYGASSPLAEEIRKIKELEGYLSLYVSKANPVMNGIATAPEFQATSEGGHTFQESGTDTGMFLSNNNEPEFRINNVVKGIVGNSPSINSPDNTFVTVKMLKDFKEGLLPVGISIITQDPRNPSTYMGFGTWELDLQGKSLVGVSSDVTINTPDWAKSVNSEFGEFKHQQTEAEMFPHKHSTTAFNKFVAKISDVKNSGYVIGSSLGASRDTLNEDNEIVVGGITSSGFSASEEVPVGSGKPFNIVQPSKTKFIFTRVG